MFDWQGLEVFVAAARVENFSAAAQELHLSQPAVTQRIQALERDMGVSLFERQGRRVFLSEAGAYLLPMAQDLIRRGRRMEETMHSLSGEIVGHLVLGCSTASGKYILPGLLARFCQQHTAVRSTIRVGSRSRILELLRTRGVHIGFSSAPVEQRDITYSKFCDDTVVLIAPPSHPWTKRSSIRPEELLQEKLILREDSSGTYQSMMQGLVPHDIASSELQTVMTLGNAEAIIMAVEEGIGVGFVPLLSASRCLQVDRVKIVPIDDVKMIHTIWMAENTAEPATAAQIEFLKMIRNEELVLPADDTIPIDDVKVMI
jgi:DNA-binding transcriptional LysR family regulator